MPAILPAVDSFSFGPADAIIVVPPFCDLHTPSLGAHTIQACARAAGFDVRVLYANIHFAATIGAETYVRCSHTFRGTFVGERLFARSAYDLPALGHRAELMFTMTRALGGPIAAEVYGEDPARNRQLLDELPAIEAQVPAWTRSIASMLAAEPAAVIGATSTFEQTGSAMSLLRAVKALDPSRIAILGGANCEGEMAEGIVALAPFLDYVFSGESEKTFPAFLAALARGERPALRIQQGQPCRNLDSIPLLDYDDYFEQRAAWLDSPAIAAIEETALPYETSRGCWWGEKSHCTFCGLNGEGMAFRSRSPGRALDDLRFLTKRYDTRKVLMSDNIMPHKFFGTFIPQLAEQLPGLDLFYEQKANLTREKLVALRKAGVNLIQPGIEALSSGLLRLMRKGVSSAQNVALLRDARAVNMSLVWNLLWGFPNDLAAYYEETRDLIPNLVHLQPPGGFWPVMIDRFCPYFEDPENYGISNVRPLPGYDDILPSGAPAAKLAYHFEGDFVSGSYAEPDLLRAVQDGVAAWRQAWSGERLPELRVAEHEGAVILLDTRGLPGTEAMDVLDPDEALRLTASAPFRDSPGQRSLIERKLALRLDDWFVPLTVVDGRTIAFLEACADIPPAEAPLEVQIPA
jgi:ribosomal peptide maturation radical SAM protein 1